MTKVTWLGHAAFLLESKGVSVLIDPFLDGNPSCPVKASDMKSVDIVVVTHDHGDHVGQAVEICKSTGAMLAAVVGTAEKIRDAGVPQKQILNGIGFNIGGTVQHKGVSLTMTHAYHTSESGVPVGYIVTMPDGFVAYHAGDTSLYGDMAWWGQLYPLNMAMLPMGGVFTMDAQQAAYACRLLACKKVIPMHWGTFPVLAKDTKEFKQQLQRTAPDCECVDMKAGESKEFVV